MKDKRNIDEKSNILMVMAAYSVLTVVILAVSVISLTNAIKRPNSLPSYETIIEYVFVSTSEADTENDKQTEETDRLTDSDKVYIVREHMGEIGVFSQDGALLMTIDVHTKALPKADRELLEKGFEIIGKSQLNAIIEDYTG